VLWSVLGGDSWGGQSMKCQHGALAQSYRQLETEDLREHPLTRPMCPPQIPHGLAWDWTGPTRLEVSDKLPSDDTSSYGVKHKKNIFRTFRRVRKITKIDYKLRHVCLSSLHGSTRLPVESFFHKICYLLFENQGLLKSDKSNGYCTRRRMYVCDISLNSS
jgi:hypothetical protein